MENFVVEKENAQRDSLEKKEIIVAKENWLLGMEKVLPKSQETFT